jgi:hypothetical protein
MPKFPIYDISDVEQIDFEQMGTKSKFWYKNDQNELFLFKATLTTDKEGNDIQRYGEDWAEKIACEITKLLNIPAANYDLAIFRGQAGIITKNFVGTKENMLYGNSIISHLENILVNNSYLPLTETKVDTQTSNEKHDVTNIFVCLENFVKNKPLNWNSLPQIKTAIDVFAGYLMFDTLISNQDRHNENWGMIYASMNHTYLAPSFDHAASLGRNESDEKRLIRLTTTDKGQTVASYVNKAKSQIIDEASGKRLSTIYAFELFGKCFALDASLSWINQLKLVDNEQLKSIVWSIPDSIISEISKQFAYNIIIENKKRILDLQTSFIAEKKKESDNE